MASLDKASSQPYDRPPINQGISEVRNDDVHTGLMEFMKVFYSNQKTIQYNKII